MKKKTGMKWLGLLAAGLLGLWPTDGLRAQAAATMADAETSAEAIKCDTIRMTWEAEAGEEKSLSFMVANQLNSFRVDWGDGVSSEESRELRSRITARHVYEKSGVYEVLLYSIPYVGPVGSYYTETAFGMEMPMVYVKGGTFEMGATLEQGSDARDNEKPVHSVTLSDFYIGQYEVTQAQWAAVMGTSLSDIIEENGWNSYGLGDDYPMYDVSWNDAVEFCTKLSQKTGKTYRLPTEAEWEYAARGGQNADGTKYAGSNTIGDVAWYDGNSGSKTHPVAQKMPNGLGLCDMSGNVWEWCQDWYGSNYYSGSPAVNPQGPTSGSARVHRGGSWYDSAQYCRVSIRHNNDRGSLYINVGFRVVCEP